ncbi:putative zinc cluster transcription factor [Scheffersomyces xylosifermentans]|uniref:putative zinc cluster transcription factor n=1 Tax=Scheffersomyces xylosifermentans TaxID=1304137 RepID=UPI00315DA6EB
MAHSIASPGSSSSDSDENRSSTEEPKKRNRVRTGCFCCRKRKKKCDETRPSCNACVRNRVKCIYPTRHNEPLPVDFSLEEADNEEVPQRKSRKRSKNINGTNDPNSLFNVIVLNPGHVTVQSHSERNTPTGPELQNIFEYSTETKRIPKSSKKRKIKVEEAKIFEIKSPVTDIDDTATTTASNASSPSDPITSELYGSSAVTAFTGSPSGDKLFIANSKYIPNVTLATQDSELYYHFIHAFMPSVSLPHSHPMLSPDHVWVQLASQSEILTDVYLCCGASYLAYLHDTHGVESKEMTQHYAALAESKYSQAVSSLSTAVSNSSIDLDSDWLFAACLALCLRDRSFGLNGSRCAKHLIFVYNLIKRRDIKKRETLKEEETFTKDISSSLATRITPNERSFIDSFVFNYSAALLSCSIRDLITLPSPFEFFPHVRQWLNYPIYKNCDVKWMNNPVLGSALDSFEVISKLSWLLRLHFNYGDDSEIIQDHYIGDETFWNLILPLRNDIEMIERRNAITQEELNTLKIKSIKSYKALRSNLAVSIMTINASKILLEKIINPILPSFLTIIQVPAKTILEELCEHIPLENHSSCLITLSLFIAGISIIDLRERQLLAHKLIEISNMLCSNVGKNILKILQIGWEKENVDKTTFNSGDKGYKCFDLIFDRPSIESITF